MFLSLTEESKKYNYKALVLIFPYKYETLDKYNERKKHQFTRNILKKYNIEWIDFLDVWRNKNFEEREQLYMADDKVHLSRVGMREVSKKLYEYVLNGGFKNEQ